MRENGDPLYVSGEAIKDMEAHEVPERFKNSGSFRKLSILQHSQAGVVLKHICREAIRKHLLELDPHSHLFGRIPRLGLPHPLKQYLLYEMSLDSDSDDDSDNDD